MSTQCCVTIHDRYSFRGRPCSKPAKVEVNGKFYCKAHDPVATQKRRDERQAKWEAEYAIKTQRWTFDREAKEAVRAIARGHNDPQALCREILGRAGESVDA